MSSRSRPSSRLPDSLTGLGRLLVWSLVLLVPVVILPSASDAFRLPKLMLAEWLGLASLLAFALGAALRPSRGVGGAGPMFRSRVLTAIAPMVLVATLGWVATDHPEHVRQALADLWIGAACLVGWSLALPSGRLERILAGLGVPGVLLAALGILQFHGIFEPFSFTRGEEAHRLGVSSLAGNTGDLAAFLLFPVLVAQWRLAAPGAGRRSRLAWGAVLAVCLYGIAATQTLTALAAVLAGSVVLWALRLPWRKAAGTVGAVVVVAAVFVLAVTPVRERLERSVERLAEGDWDVALSGRLDGWKAALWMVRQEPVLGVGHGAYRAEFAPAKLALLDEGASFYRHHVDPFFANAHNELLEAGAEWGVLGWAALGWLLWFLVQALRAGGGGEGAWERHDLGFAWGALAGLMVLALGQFPFRLALAAYPALLLGAWIFRGAQERGEGKVEAPAEVSSHRRWWSSRRLIAGALAVVLAAALVAQTGRWIDRVGASKRLRVVDVVTARTSGASGRVPREVIHGNLRLLREARRLDPSQVEAPAGIAAQYLLSDSPRRAEEAYLEALSLEPRPELYLNLGRARLSLGERSGALEAFSDAIRLAPRLRQEIPSTMRREVGD